MVLWLPSGLIILCLCSNKVMVIIISKYYNTVKPENLAHIIFGIQPWCRLILVLKLSRINDISERVFI